MNRYTNQSSNPKWNAQRNLTGRTHYVDEDTLKFHKSRVLHTYVVDNGLFFALVESVALDMNNRSRGFRFVIFDLFGTILERPNLEATYSTTNKACKAMWAALDGLDAVAVTSEGIARFRANATQEADEIEATLPQRKDPQPCATQGESQ